MKIIYDIETMRFALDNHRSKAQKICLVPTMGALHKGHIALIEAAKAKGDIVVVSIFVNVKQFDREDDFKNYPRQLQKDCELLQQHGVDYVFAPPEAEMWPKDWETIVETTYLANILIGKERPGHFRGVTTVVAKLFNIIKPNFAFFGEKDFQQLTIIRRMVDDLNFDVQIIGVPIIREDDGVAFSSRNQLLTKEHRARAVILYQSLICAQEAFNQQITNVDQLKQVIRDKIAQEPNAKLQLVNILNSKTLAEVKGDVQKGDVVLLFVAFGEVQLLDQYIMR